MSEQKPKKTFLKKGARPFLSNATVRSLSQKQKIVDFEQDNFQAQSSPFVNTSTKNQQKEQIVINVKSKNLSKDKHSTSINNKQNAKKSSNFIGKNKEQKSQQQNIEIFQKPIQVSNSISKSSQKKPTLLADYLNNDQKSSKKTSQTNIPIPLPKQNGPKITPSSFAQSQSQAQHLKMQDIQDDSDEDHFVKQINQDDENEFTKTFLPKNLKHDSSPQQIKRNDNVLKKPNLLQEAFAGKKQKENVNLQNQKNEEKQVNFQSDSDEDQKQRKNQFKYKNNKNIHNNRFRQQPQQEENQKQSDGENEQMNRKATVKLASKPQSKVTQMFNKNSKVSTQSLNEPTETQSLKTKKMTIDDVPKQLIEQIVEKYFKQAKTKYEKKQQNLFQQVKIVEKKQQSLNQQQKVLQKRGKQFQKQLEQKNKQFENKLKSQQNKITRQKMYLKDQQTGNKVDWKTKNQVQELKQQLEEQRNQRKRIQVKLKGQLDRLKIRYNEDMEVKKNLEMRIKQYELKDIKEKEVKVKEQKQLKKQIIQRKKTFWDDAPKQSYLQKFYNNNFSLNQFFMEDYFYQHNQFYQYYSKAGETDTLQTQEVEGNKIKRTYENGKVQIESIQKFVKEVFPWGFTIVHYINGDIKQVIQLPNRNDLNSPKKLQIYYAKNNQIIEYSITEAKRIHYFLAQDQIQLNDQFVHLKEIFNGKQLQRVIQGNSVILQKNAKGNFVQIY